MGDWSMLPIDILGYIALKLDAAEDFVYFSDVCRSWNKASSSVKNKWRAKVPLLMLAENTKRNPTRRRKVFSMSRNRCYQLKLPQTFGSRCWGTQYGWIIIYDIKQLYLLNPLTKARIHLPPPSTLPRRLGKHKKETRNWILQCYIERAILHQVGKNSSNDFIVLVVHGIDPPCVAFARPGDQRWTLVRLPDLTGNMSPTLDIACYNGQMFFLYWDGKVGYCGIDALSKTKDLEPLKLIECLPGPPNVSDEVSQQIMKLYLVEVFGHLFMVVRYKVELVAEDNVPKSKGYDNEYSYATKSFKVYRLDFDSKRWIQVNSLGGVALFLGDNSSMFVLARNDVCKSNCIYFTDDEVDLWTAPEARGGHDIGVFNVEMNEMGDVYDGYDMHSSFCTPFWFLPQF